MALLGAQLVITLIMVSVIQKFSPHFSFAKWVLCSTGLIRYLHPTDSELKILAGVPKTMGGKSKKDNHRRKDKEKENLPTTDTFHIRRDLDIQLETAKITPIDVIHLRYYTEYVWLVDFSLYAAIVYILSEVYHFYFPLKEEINLSMVWCLLVIFFAFKLLISLTVQYFRSEESIGERSTCIVTGLTYLLIAMITLIIDENTLETGLGQAYTSFNHSASIFLEAQGINSSGPASKIIINFFIAIFCAILGAIFTFPGIRMARMHWDSLKYCKENKILQILLNLSFVLPFILVILWIRPVSRYYLTEHIFSGMSSSIFTSNVFETVRLVLVVFAVILRISLMPIYLQAYLNLAYDRIEEQKKEAGRITNIELQRKIASIFYYLCVVTLQYVAPIIMCLYFALMYKTLGGYTWIALFKDNVINETMTIPAQSPIIVNNPEEILSDTILQSSQSDEFNFESITEVNNEHLLGSSTEDIQMSLHNLKSIFSTEVYRGVFGFATWWSCFVWFAATSLGLVYQTYFTKL